MRGSLLRGHGYYCTVCKEIQVCVFVHVSEFVFRASADDPSSQVLAVIIGYVRRGLLLFSARNTEGGSIRSASICITLKSVAGHSPTYEKKKKPIGAFP